MLANAHLTEIARWVLAHHERPDGRGFPRGLSDGEIPLEARILAVADAYVAMTSERPYRAALDHDAARNELRKHSSEQFDSRVVEAFIESLGEGRGGGLVGRRQPDGRPSFLPPTAYPTDGQVRRWCSLARSRCVSHAVCCASGAASGAPSVD